MKDKTEGTWDKTKGAHYGMCDLRSFSFRPCSSRSVPSRRWSRSSPRSGRRSLLVAHHADVLGHLLGLLSGARPTMRDGCFLYVSDRGLANRVLTRRGYVAITFGHVVVFAHQPTARLWRHELAHVGQYERYGIAFLPLYLWLYARHGYAAHPFEREAAELARLDA